MPRTIMEDRSVESQDGLVGSSKAKYKPHEDFGLLMVINSIGADDCRSIELEKLNRGLGNDNRTNMHAVFLLDKALPRMWCGQH